MIILPSRNGMLLRNSNGILAADCGGPVEFSCDCELLTGTNCSCYGTNLTPSTYIADFGEMGRFCLNYVSGCTWQKSVGTITVTLNLTYTTNTTRLTVVDGSTTVFSGDLVAASCNGRKYGAISNTVSPSDWGDGVFFTKCNDGCFGRFVVFELDYGSPFIAAGPYVPLSTRLSLLGPFNSNYKILGYMGDNCRMSVSTNIPYYAYRIRYDTYNRIVSCSVYEALPNHTSELFVQYNQTTSEWTVGHYSRYVFYSRVTHDVSQIPVGGSIQLSSQRTKRVKINICSLGFDYLFGPTDIDGYMPGTATITVY